MAVAIAAVSMGLLGLAVVQSQESQDPSEVESPFDDAMREGSQALAESSRVLVHGDPRTMGSAAAARVARHEQLVVETGGDDVYYSGMLDRNVRTDVNQLRSAHSGQLPSLEVMQKAGVWAQQLAQDRRYQQSLAPNTQAGDRGTSTTRVRPVFLNYLAVPNETSGRPFVRQLELDSKNNVKHDTTGPVDTNRLLWFTDPYNLANPFQPFNKTRSVPTGVLPDSQQLEPLSDREVAQLLPRPGLAARSGPSRRLRAGAKTVRFVR